jgi:7-carboxy-7-deazaguanine synthase
MVRPLILANPTSQRQPRPDGSPVLQIAEHFSRTIQGENFVGVPSAFLRLKNCTLNCVWCDTLSVWKAGNPYSVDELLDMWVAGDLAEDLRRGHHLVLTGGSPLLQQSSLIALIEKFKQRFDFVPFIEVENECTLMPDPKMFEYVSLWNNSPKLANSKMSKKARHKPDVLKALSDHGKKNGNVYWKFVVTCEQEWQEIVDDFITPGFVLKKDLVLMPEGQTRDELLNHYEFVVDLCCREGVRMTDRAHITIWGKKTGV